ncbi:MAG: hotdog fold thioesterase [Chloroflexi bacterium]|nr:hotdog fold thioesterase [Chloroflexota bacterium]
MVSEKIREHLLRDKFAESLGIELLELREGYAKCSMIVRDAMLNAHKIAHGAAIFTLADFAFAAACNSYGQVAVALEVKINFLDAVKSGTRLIGEASEEAVTKRIGLYHLTVRDEGGKLIASAQATAYRKQEWFGGRGQ